MENTLLDELYNQIEVELGFCDPVVLPYVTSQFSDMDTRAQIIKLIAENCISRKSDIAQSIAEIERLYNLNSIE